MRYWFRGKLLPLPGEWEQARLALEQEVARLRDENEQLKKGK